MPSGKCHAFSLILLAFAVLLAAAGCSSESRPASSRNFFYSLFIKGRPEGTLVIKPQAALFEKESNGEYTLKLTSPKTSSLTYSFTLDEVPGEYYMLNDWMSSPSEAEMNIFINGREFIPSMKNRINHYISQGFEISRELRKGENTVAITLESGDQLWIRGTIFADNPSLAKNVSNLPDLIPKYGKTAALVLGILVILYFIWFFFNRTLYSNMDAYSASFALIGIMIAGFAAGYCWLVIPRMQKWSLVYLACTVVLALISMLSAKKGEDAFQKSVAIEGEARQEDKPSGTDFNF
ncbi:MAG: hypothetical protein RDV48_15075 [Candidatus Eremiobacteraeota bacterium]|nr:hypothetical protein [Candidatus Eremiobacteraeota bacterium]